MVTDDNDFLRKGGTMVKESGPQNIEAKSIIVKNEKEVGTMQDSNVIIYGIPLEVIHDKKLGPILEGNKDYPFFGILYCGFKTGTNEVRQPTQRLWYFKKTDVVRSGKVTNFILEETSVHYYEICLDTDIQEKYYKPVDIGIEISDKPRIFGSKIMVKPKGGINMDEIKGMTREELENTIANFIETKTKAAGGLPIMESILGTCNTWYQTYCSTRYDPWVRSDRCGADCDE